MDWTLYILILAITIVVVSVIAWGMRLAYKQGYADGQLAASMKHTELTIKQWAQQQLRQQLKEKPE